MMFRSLNLIAIAFLIACSAANAQELNTDSLQKESKMAYKYRLSGKNLILPTAFVGYGAASLHFNMLKRVNTSTREEINEHNPMHIKLDNYTQYAPALLVYGLNACGLKGMHNFKERTIIYASSQLITAAIVVPLKRNIKEERPDAADNWSFPSGHTATAFSSAHFMFREYKNSNLLVGLAGYPFAIVTGAYRTLNDKHWVGDVVAGAGIGILSTELAYALYPKVNALFSRKDKGSTMITPYYAQNGIGVGLVKSF
ncbi:phosphoesterase PA-phosphatase related protein [Pseudopedobacter saltans DSM 12145]|uniref:Phosphoesterase PA-phosphatase related protein n=1 Tax=Pseudopedobacter saltans (strain ATCC 51119 / DSM 12145 / JCM 21818 / CCUG 39354 / LMG 10337 / NBRC 100064 / NCIMB 13643) TaxID=762903 RepID=F0S6N7_PSESL|nr:phosphatase PAP2 family protein [Pseudopedobacter saltans]ADY51113.1 phosphoesterase PA-phosphatase related protein [Pseudopedobacter saltans DSM 12145]